MEEVHHRMPLILYREDIEKWLFLREEAVRLLKSHYEELEKNKSEEFQQMSLF